MSRLNPTSRPPDAGTTARQTLWFWLMAGPALLGFLIFNLGPMLASFGLSFTQYDVVDPPRWVGVRNYLYLFRNDPAFWPSVRVTFVFAAVSVPVGLLLSLGVALLLNQPVRFRGAFRTIYFLPSLLPAAASGVIWVFVFHPDYGILNRLLGIAHVAGPAWTYSVQWALPSLIIMALWGFGGAMIILLAGLQDVPRSLYEAASLDGASRARQLWHVTLPALSPLLFFNLVMGLIGALRAFDQAFVMGSASGQGPGGPARATLLYSLNLYQKSFNYFHMGLASAMAWVLFAAILTLTWLNFRIGKRWVHAG